MDRSLPREADQARSALPPARMAALLGVVILALALGLSTAHAQLPQLLVNAEPDGEADRFDPALVRLDDGRLQLFWSDQSGGSIDIYARIFSTALVPEGEARKVNGDGLFTHHTLTTLSQPNGGVFAAAWIDGRSGGDDTYAQVFSSSSGEPIGGNVRIKAVAGVGQAMAPEVATNADGQTLVCWMDNRGDRYRVRGQLLDGSGALLGTNFELAPENEHSGLTERNPAVAVLPDGRWLVAWDEGNGSHFEVRYRTLLSNGGMDGPSVNPADASSTGQLDPALLVRASDFLVAWTDDRGHTFDVAGQWFGLDGTKDGSNQYLQAIPTTGQEVGSQLLAREDGSFILSWFGEDQGRERAMYRCFASDRTPAAPEVPMRRPPAEVLMGRGAVAAAPEGKWVIAWSDSWSLNFQVYLDLADPLSGPADQPVPAIVVPQSGHQILPDVAFFPGGRAVVVWGDARNGDYVITARLLDEFGVPDSLIPPFRVNTVPTARKFLPENTPEDLAALAPQVAASGIGTFIVTWAVDSGGGRLSLYGQLYDAEAQPIGQNFPVSPVVPGSIRGPQFDARPAMGLDGRFAITWRDDTQEGGGDIYLQRYDAGGDSVGGVILVNDRNFRASAQQSPDLAISPYNEMVVAWIDRRGGGWDIYRQRVSAGGVRLDATDVLTNPADTEYMDQFYPSVATNGNSIVTVWDDQPLTSGYIRGRLEILESAASRGGVPGGGKSQTSQIVDFTVNPQRHPTGVKRPSVSMDPSGRFVVAWWDIENGVTRVWAQRFEADGTANGTPYVITEDLSAGHRTHVRVVVNANRIQYVWDDSRRHQGWDIYARRVGWMYNGDPTPIELNHWEAAAGSEGIRLTWSVPLGQESSLYRIWREPASGESPPARPSEEAVLLNPEGCRSRDGIGEYLDASPPADARLLYYLQAIDLSGGSRFFGPLRVTTGAPPLQVWRAEPNPFAGEVFFSPPASGAARLLVFDVSGRQVAELSREAGSVAPLRWDGTDSAGRPLPAGIYLARPSPGGAAATEGFGRAPAARPLRIVRVR